MEKRVLKGIMIWSVCCLMTACFYDNEEELYPDNTCATTNVTYTSTVLPIIRSNCYACHSSAARQGDVILEGYTALKGMVDNDRLDGAINHRTGYSPMPKDAPKLSDCQLSQVAAWISAGAPNN